MSIAADLGLTAAFDLPQAERHEVALLLGGRCRACAEPLAGGAVLQGRSCERCGEPVALDAREHGAVTGRILRRGRVRVGVLAVAIGLSHLVHGFVPTLSSIVLALSTAWIRLQIVQPASRLLGPARRPVAVWTARLATSALVAATIVVHELLTLMPVVGPLAKGLIATAEVAFVGWANERYMRWQLEREERGAPVAWWEIAVIACALAALVLSTVAIMAIAATVIAAIQALAPRLLT